MPSALRCVFPVLPTPFSPDGAPDHAALATLLEFAIDAGADGVVYPGMASEVETLAPTERREAVAALGRALRGRLPLIVGASDADPRAAAARAEEGREAGAVAAMVMAPAGAGADVARQVAFFEAVADGTTLPLMLQNAPAPMGAGLKPDAVGAIARAVPAIAYVKEETLPCGQNVSAILAAGGRELAGVFGGAGARYVIDELARGAAGTMPALELADIHVRLVRAHRAGDLADARRLYGRTLPLLLHQAVFRVRTTKAVLRARGLLRSALARAAGPVPDAHDEAELAALLADAADLFAIHPPAPSDAASLTLATSAKAVHAPT